MAAFRRSYNIFNVPDMLGESNFTVFCQIIAGTGINTVLYSRKMFPVRSFKTSFLNAVDVQILQKNYSNADITDFNNALRGVFEAIGKCYVQQLAVVLLPRDDRYSVYEKFVFNMNYNTNKFELIGATGIRTVLLDNTDLNRPNLIPEIFTKIKEAINIRRFEVLPVDATPSIFMSYYEEYTPTLYQPEGFFDCNTMDYAFMIKSLRVNLGKISTTFTPIRFQIAAAQPSTSRASSSENKFIAYARQMITVAINHILYTRRVFPPNCFTSLLYGDVVQVLERDCLNDETICDRVIEIFRWILGAVDAIEKGYLRQLVITMGPKHKPHKVYENYVIILNYHLCTVEIIGTTSKVVTKITLDDMEGEILCYRVIQLMESGLKATSLGLLPEDAEPSIFITYYDNITPTIYQPYGFYKNHIEKFPFLIEFGNSVNAKLSCTIERVYETVTTVQDTSPSKVNKEKQKMKKSKKDLKKKVGKNKKLTSGIISIIKKSSSYLSNVPDIKTTTKKKMKLAKTDQTTNDQDIASGCNEPNEQETSTTYIDLGSIASTSGIQNFGTKRSNTSEPKKKTSKRKKVDPDIHNIPSTSASADASKTLYKSSPKKQENKKAKKKQKPPAKVVQTRSPHKLPSSSSTDTSSETSKIQSKQQKNDANVIRIEPISASSSRVTDNPSTNLLSDTKNIITVLEDIIQSWDDSTDKNEASVQQSELNFLPAPTESRPVNSKAFYKMYYNASSPPCSNQSVLPSPELRNVYSSLNTESNISDYCFSLQSKDQLLISNLAKFNECLAICDESIKVPLGRFVQNANFSLNTESVTSSDHCLNSQSKDHLVNSNLDVFNANLSECDDNSNVPHDKFVQNTLSCINTESNISDHCLSSPTKDELATLNVNIIKQGLVECVENVNETPDKFVQDVDQSSVNTESNNTDSCVSLQPKDELATSNVNIIKHGLAECEENVNETPDKFVQDVDQSSVNTESNNTDSCVSLQPKDELATSNVNIIKQGLAECEENVNETPDKFVLDVDQSSVNTESNNTHSCVSVQRKDELATLNVNIIKQGLVECVENVNETPDKFVLDVDQPSVNTESNNTDSCVSLQPKDELATSNVNIIKQGLAECEENVNETPDKFVLDVDQPSVNTESNNTERCLSHQPKDELATSNVNIYNANLAECDENVNETTDKFVLDVDQSSVNTESNNTDSCVSPQPKDELVNSNVNIIKQGLAECDENIHTPLDKLVQNIHPSVNTESNISHHCLNLSPKDQLVNSNLNIFNANLAKCDDSINVPLSKLSLDIQPSVNTELNISDHCLSPSSKDQLPNSNLVIFKQDSAECNENFNVQFDKSVQKQHQPSVNTELNILGHCLSPQSTDLLLNFNLDIFNQDFATWDENVNVSFGKFVPHADPPSVNVEPINSDHYLSNQTNDQMVNTNLDILNKDSTKCYENLNVPLGKFEMFNQIFYNNMSMGYNVSSSQNESEDSSVTYYDFSSISLHANGAYSTCPFSTPLSDYNQMKINDTAINIQSVGINLQKNDSSCSNLNIMETDKNNSDLNIQSNAQVINNETALNIKQQATSLQNQEKYFIHSDANNTLNVSDMRASTSHNINVQDSVCSETFYTNIKSDALVIQDNRNELHRIGTTEGPAWNQTEHGTMEKVSSVCNEPTAESQTVSNVHVIQTSPFVSTDNKQNDSDQQSDLSIKNKEVMDNSDIETWCTTEAINDIEHITLEKDFGSIFSVTYRDSWNIISSVKSPSYTPSGDDIPSHLRITPLTPSIPTINVEDVNSDLERPVTPKSIEDDCIVNEEVPQEDKNNETESETDASPLAGNTSSGYTSSESTKTESEVDQARDMNITVNCYCPTKQAYHFMIQCFVCETWQHAMCYAFLDLLPKPGHTFFCCHCLHSFTFRNADSLFIQLPIDKKYELAWFHRCINYTMNRFYVTTEELISDLKIPLVLQTPVMIKLVKEGVLRPQPNRLEYEVRDLPNNFYSPKFDKTLKKIKNLEKNVTFIKEYEMVYLDETLMSPVVVDESESET